MSVIRSLEMSQLDALRETANIGAGHAATALSHVTDSTIMIKVSNITLASRNELPTQLTPDEEPVASVLMHILGDLSGRTVLVCPKPTALRLAELMLRRPVGSSTAFTELEASAIEEAGNILSGAYMNALSQFLGVLLLPSPPTLLIDMSTAVLARAICDFSADPNMMLCVESEFQLVHTEPGLRGFFLLFPEPASVHLMLRALRLA